MHKVEIKIIDGKKRTEEWNTCNSCGEIIEDICITWGRNIIFKWGKQRGYNQQYIDIHGTDKHLCSLQCLINFLDNEKKRVDKSE